MKFEGTTTKYPDIVIQNNKKKVFNLIDVKTDIGWNRSGLFSFCKEWEKRIESVKGTKTSFKNGIDKSVVKGSFSKKLKYHVVVITKVNSGNKIDEDYGKVKEQLKNVCLYILSDGLHPNNYDLSVPEIMERIKIHHDDFDRLLSHIVK
jgi:hypothetical protein